MLKCAIQNMLKHAIQNIKNFFVAIPSFFLPLVPIFKSCPPCPFCMPKYAAILSFFGVPLADYNHILTPIMLISMSFTIASLFYQAKKYHYNFLAANISLVSCLWILVFRFWFEWLELSYLGMAGLLASIVINQNKLNQRKSTCCPGH